MTMPYRAALPASSRIAVVVGLGLAAALPARAQAVSPFYLGASQTFTHETNVARTRDNPVGDTISTTALLGGFDRFVGRQHVYLNGTLRRSVFRDNDRYDNTGYSLVGGLDWSTANRISGSAALNLNRSLSPIGQVVNNSSPERNVATTTYFDTAARIGTVTPLTLEGTYSYQRVDYSAAALNFAEFSQHTVGANLQYRSSAQLTTGVGVRFSRGRYPSAIDQQNSTPGNTVFAVDDYTGRNLDLTLNWTPSALSTVTGRVSYNRTERDLSRREFSGFTGNVVWRWQPTGKWRLNTQLARATGEDAIFIAARPVLNQTPTTSTGNYSNVANTLSVNAQYLATGKITVEGNASLVRRTLRNVSTDSTGTTTSDEGTDNTRIIGLTVRYAATRALQLSCNVGRDVRSASTTLSYPYHASYFGCTGQLTLQP